MKLCQLASGQCFRGTRAPETGFNWDPRIGCLAVPNLADREPGVIRDLTERTTIGSLSIDSTRSIGPRRVFSCDTLPFILAPALRCASTLCRILQFALSFETSQLHPRVPRRAPMMPFPHSGGSCKFPSLPHSMSTPCLGPTLRVEVQGLGFRVQGLGLRV